MARSELGSIQHISVESLSNSWREAGRGWGHSLHTLAPYVGGFPPALAHYFIKRFSAPGDAVYDPFCGGGTVPLEACLTDRRGWGSDAFRYATTVTSAKVAPQQTRAVEQALTEIGAEAASLDIENIDADTDRVGVFYSDYTLGQLVRYREVLRHREGEMATYLNALICAILHGPSEMFLSVPTKDTYASTPGAIENQIEERGLVSPVRDIEPSVLRKHQLVTADPIERPFDARVEQADARSMPVPEDSVDLLLTSPPYLKVLDYTWNNWVRLWWLGADRQDERDKLDLTEHVGRYTAFMQAVGAEIERVLAPGGTAVIVVGDVKKARKSGTEVVSTAHLLAKEWAETTGLHIDHIIDDAYELENRGYAVFNQLKYEYSEGDTEDKAGTPIDRCLVVTNREADLPESPEINWDLRGYTGQQALSEWS